MMILKITLFAVLCVSGAKAVADIDSASPEQFAESIGLEDTLLIDVRTPAETAEAKIKGAIEINFDAPDFEEQISQLPTDTTILLYCRSGNRSGQSATFLESLDYENLVNLEGGMIAWKAEGRPVLSSDSFTEGAP